MCGEAGGLRLGSFSPPSSEQTQRHTCMRPVNLPQLTTVINVWKDQVHIHYISVSSDTGKESNQTNKAGPSPNRKMPSGREACINQQCAKRKTSWGLLIPMSVLFDIPECKMQEYHMRMCSFWMPEHVSLLLCA